MTTVDLFETAMYLDQAGTVRTGRLITAGEDDELHLAMFHAESDRDVHGHLWEMHPAGDEVVGCVQGRIHAYLRCVDPADDEELAELGPGQACVIPQGRWHRLAVAEPCDFFAITPTTGSRLEPRRTSTDR